MFFKKSLTLHLVWLRPTFTAFILLHCFGILLEDMTYFYNLFYKRI